LLEEVIPLIFTRVESFQVNPIHAVDAHRGYDKLTCIRRSRREEYNWKTSLLLSVSN
jgi:hypothetical protein